MKWAYYNDHDLYVCEWVRNLIRAGLIMDGEVDSRDIRDVRPYEISQFIRVHMFCGIAGWDRALSLAGWPADRKVWTGSAPCQPFSAAGARRGFADERHLWPFWYHLISVGRPSIVFGEQVASKDGREWLAGVRADLEALGFACGAADLCAAGVGSPQIRQRIYWLAYANGADQDGRPSSRQQSLHDKDDRDFERLGRAESEQWNGRGAARARRAEPTDASAPSQGLGFSTREQMGQRRQPWQLSDAAECDDGWRRIEPGTFPLAHDVPQRVAKLRAFGNAIVPPCAKEFIAAYMECRP